MMRRVDTVSVMNFQVQQKATRTSSDQIHLPKEVGQEHMTFLILCTDISLSAPTNRLGGTKSGPRRDVASSCCGQNELPLLGYRVLRGSQPVISFSQASSGAPVCVVRLRTVLCGKRLTKSWKLMASVSAIMHNHFSETETQVLHRTSNKRGADYDPNSFHTNMLRGGCWTKEHTAFHFETLCVCQIPSIPAPSNCCPMPPKSGSMNFFATFSK